MDCRRTLLGLFATITLLFSACSSSSETDPTASGPFVDGGEIREGNGGPGTDAFTGIDGGSDAPLETPDGTPDYTVADTNPPDTGTVTTGDSEVEPNNNLGTANVIGLTPETSVSISARLVPGDYDFFKFTLDAAAEFQAETSDGAGDCLLDTKMAILDSAGEEISMNDDGGEGMCSLLASVALVYPGDYYIQVFGYGDDENGPYTLTASLTEPRCGDLRLSAGEECDDGNTNSGDGCHECRFEAIDEIEPNDDTLEAHEVEGLSPSTPLLFRGAVDADDVDYYAVDMDAGDGFIRIDVMRTGGTCFDAKVELIGTDGSTVLDEDTYWGYGSGSSCATLAGTSDIEDLEDGTHYIRVSATDSGGGYLLNLVVRRARCGNGIREGTETCDDANEDPDDGCDACTLDAELEEEPNDDIPDANDLGSLLTNETTAVWGEVEDGDNDYFKVTVAEHARLEIWTDDGGSGCDFDTVIQLFNSDGESLGTDDSDGELSCSLLDKDDEGTLNLDAGQYLILVKGYSSYSEGFYVLHVSAIYPGCGNGETEGAEVCDDGNTDDGDGCSSSCEPEGTAETESNNSIGDATVVTLPADGTELFYIGETSLTDADYFGFTVTEGAQIHGTLWNGSGGCNVDSKVSLRHNADVVRLGASMTAGCWQVGGTADPYTAGTTLDAGTYYLRVVGTTAGDAGAYQLIVWATYP